MKLLLALLLSFLFCAFSTSASLAASASDDFNRANDTDLGANWDTDSAYNACQIAVSQVSTQSFTGSCNETYNAVSLTANQSTQITLSTWVTGNEGFAGAVTRSDGAGTFYACYAVHDNGSQTTVLTRMPGFANYIIENATTWTATDVLKLVSIGSDHTCYRNGSPVLNLTDATIASGKPGIWTGQTANDFTDTSIDDWFAQDEVGVSGVSGVLRRRTQ
jgi:hypothetical protein